MSRRRFMNKSTDSSLWLYCPFTANAQDQSGNKRNVNVNNVSFTSDGALTKGSNDSYIDTGYTFDTASHATTLVFRVKDLSGTSLRDNAFIFGALEPYPSNWPNYMWSFHRNDADVLQFYAYGGNFGEYKSSILRTGHRKVAIVYTQQSSKLYIDDTLYISISGSSRKGSTSLCFGVRHNPDGRMNNPCSIQLRNLRIYDRELSMSEIKSLDV